MLNRLLPAIVVQFVLLLSFSSFAQQSKPILDQLSDKAKTFDNLYAEYTFSLEDAKNSIHINEDCRIWIRNKKFHIDLPEYMVISDGKNVWTYEKEKNICTIDFLDDIKDGGLDPAQLFTIWEDDFKHEWKREEKVDGSSIDVIYLHPNKPLERTFHTIQLFVDNQKLEIKQAVVKGVEGEVTTYAVTKFEPDAEFSPYKFVFNKPSYPGVIIEDNRL